MLDIGWAEMAIIMLVALIVIGPKDLPRVARTVGRWAAKGRALAREFQNSLEEMAREAELDKVKSEIEKAGRANPKTMIEKTIDPKGELGRALDVNDGEASTDRKRATADAKAPPSEAADDAKATPATALEKPAAPSAAADAKAAPSAGAEKPASPSEAGRAEPAKRSEAEQVRRPEPVD